MGSIPYMISDEEVHFTDKVLVSVDARKCSSLKWGFDREISNEMSCALVNNLFHSQLPCSQIDLFNLNWKYFVSMYKGVANIKLFYHVLGHFQLCCVSIFNKDFQALFCYISIQSITRNVSIIACILKDQWKLLIDFPVTIQLGFMSSSLYSPARH